MSFPPGVLILLREESARPDKGQQRRGAATKQLGPYGQTDVFRVGRRSKGPKEMALE